MVFFFKQKTSYEMRISDWSSDVCSSDLCDSAQKVHVGARRVPVDRHHRHLSQDQRICRADGGTGADKSLAGAMGALCLLLRLLLLDVPDAREEIGRASCRERVCQDVLISVVAVYLKKKIKLT